jgi:RND family efflux transporter MFP subunit
MSRPRKAFLLPIAVIVGGLVIAVGLVRLAPRSEAFVPERAVPTVRTETVQVETAQATVSVSGVTSPAREITVLPEVTGRVDFISSALVPGGRVQAGDVLVRIEARDFELALEQQRGQVRSAELEVELEIARQETALQEWEILGDGGEPSPLVLRESQRAAAEMNLLSSRSALARAELELERTVIRAPFNASVIEESVDVGQVVGLQTTIARLVGTDQLRVTLSVRLEDLALIEVPGSAAIVKQRLRTGQTIDRAGRVVGLVDRLDPQTRRAEVIVMIDDPLDGGGDLPLLPGSNVEAEIEGRTAESVVRVPRGALYDGNTVWVVSPEGTLESRVLEPAWADDDALFVREGLAAGEEIVTSPLIAPVEGTRVQPIRGDG